MEERQPLLSQRHRQLRRQRHRAGAQLLEEIQDEAYLFILDEDYYQAMAKILEERFANWQGQDFDEDTLEPSEVAQAIMEYLDCECTYFLPWQMTIPSCRHTATPGGTPPMRASCRC